MCLFLQEFLKYQANKGGLKPKSQTAGDGKGPGKGGNKAQSSLKKTAEEKSKKRLFLLSFSIFDHWI